MFAGEIYAAVQTVCRCRGKSRREAARVFGLSRDTIAKMCRYSAPPGYVRSKSPERPKLGPLVPVIDAILEADKTAPPKQRHTAKRIFERLRDRTWLRRRLHGGEGLRADRPRQIARGLRPARPSARPRAGRFRRMHRRHRRRAHEAACVLFRPAAVGRLSSRPIRRRPRKPFSTGTSLQLRFSAACRSRFYMTISKSQCILGDGRRQRTRVFTELVSHYLFQERFGRPGERERQRQGRSPGEVFPGELPHARAACRLLRRAQRRSGRTLPRPASRARRPPRTDDWRKACRGSTVLRALPEPPFELCDKCPGKVSSTVLVRYRMNE
jgi:hypothetical protein